MTSPGYLRYADRFNLRSRQPCRLSAITCLDEVQQSGRQVKLSFNLPYRCQFGQQLCIVGNTERLGLWDVEKGLSMEWSKGDVWKVDVELLAQGKTKLEYKYVVKNRDGSAAVWKPGDNFRLDVPKSQQLVDSEWLTVSDGWDGKQQIQIEDLKTQDDTSVTNNQLQDSDVGQRIEISQDTAELKPLSSILDEDSLTQRQGSKELQSFSIAIKEDKVQEEILVKPLYSQKLNTLKAMEETVERAFEDLNGVIDSSIDFLDQTGEVADKEAIQSDRMVATLAQRALTLQKALSTSKPPAQFLFDDRDNA